MHQKRHYLIGKTIPVLNHGYVELVDYLGSDVGIVEAARQSTTGESKGPEQDRKLIRKMFREYHTSPFEMAETVWDMKLPIFVARQIVRIRTASLNEFSGRYSDMTDEFYCPDLDRLMAGGEHETDRQMSGGEIPRTDAEFIRADMQDDQRRAAVSRQRHRSRKLSKELSRINYPLSGYTKWRWKIDLHNLFRSFFFLRMDEHAQWECRQYANAMYPVVRELFPVSCEAFEDYQFYAHRLSRMQIEKIDQMIAAKDHEGVVLYVEKCLENARRKPALTPALVG